MTGFAEYKTLAKNKQLPTPSRLYDDISKRFENTDQQFNAGLKRYLGEKMWLHSIVKVVEKQEIATPKSGYDDDYQRQVAQRVLKRREERRNAREKENSCLIGND